MTARVRSTALEIAGPVGTLEAILDNVPERSGRFSCVICHPHPLHGGTMHNKVVTTTARSVARAGGASLRFNFRGVGASSGKFDGRDGELEDALAVLDQVREIADSDAPVVVAGFSFGGAVAYRAAALRDVAGLITIAPAWQRIPGDGRAGHPNWLLLQGDDDEVIEASGVLAWARAHEPSPQICSFESTGHFFHGRLPQLAESITTFLGSLGV